MSSKAYYSEVQKLFFITILLDFMPEIIAKKFIKKTV